MIENAIRRTLGVSLLERIWARGDMSEEEAMKLAIEAQEAARRDTP